MKTERPTRVILDTDPGVDDALALLLALHSPELEVVGVTTVCGNVPVEQANDPTRVEGTFLGTLHPLTEPVDEGEDQDPFG